MSGKNFHWNVTNFICIIEEQKTPITDASTDQQVANMPLRAYLDKTVVPILLQAMSECAKERPQYPVEFIANYLLENNPEKRSWNTFVNTWTLTLNWTFLKTLSQAPTAVLSLTNNKEWLIYRDDYIGKH